MVEPPEKIIGFYCFLLLAVSELEVSKAPDCCLEDIWADPSGVHHILLSKQQGHWETFYFHSKWKKARPIGKLKGVKVTSVGWNPETCTDSSTGSAILPSISLLMP